MKLSFSKMLLTIAMIFIFSMSYTHSYAQVATVKIITTDIFFGGVAGTLLASGVSLLQEDPDWGDNLKYGAGVGLIVGFAFGLYDGLVLRAPRRGYALLNIDNTGVTLGLPRVLVKTDQPSSKSATEVNVRILKYVF